VDRDGDADDIEWGEDDATFATEADVTCPYCGEVVSITLDPGNGTIQSYVEDCEVCCQPWQLTVTYEHDGSVEVKAEEAS
jgi:hypothetical protein